MRSRRGGRVLVLAAALLAVAGCGTTPWPGAGLASNVGPFVPSPLDPTRPNTHWHAALGVYDCDHWLGDETGPGIWNWPYATSQGHPARADAPEQYAGLHSHDDGVIHMEPATPDEAGRNATLGRYFAYGGWTVSATGYDFLGTHVANGGDCNGRPGSLHWKVARWDGTLGPQRYTVETGYPADDKLYNGDVIVIAFLPDGTAPSTTGDPPSLLNLARSLGLPPATRPSAGTAAAYSSG